MDTIFLLDSEFLEMSVSPGVLAHLEARGICQIPPVKYFVAQQVILLVLFI